MSNSNTNDINMSSFESSNENSIDRIQVNRKKIAQMTMIMTNTTNDLTY